MVDLEEVLRVTNKIINGVRQKYYPVEPLLTLKDYESMSSARIRQDLFTEDLPKITTFADENKDAINKPLVKSLDYVLEVLKKEFSSMPEDNKQMRRVLKLIAKWSALATITYKNTEEARNKTIELVTDFCIDYNKQPFLALSFAFTES